MRSKNKPDYIRQSGFIMMHTLIVVFLLAVFAVVFGRAVWIFYHKTFAQTRQIQLRVQSYSKIYETIFKIIGDKTQADHLKDPWNVQEKFGDNLVLQVEDESGKVNLTALRSHDIDFEKKMETAVRKLLLSKGVSGNIVEDFIREVQGKKDTACLEELNSYSSLDGKFKTYVDRFLTLHSDGKININTAPKEVLDVLLEAENPFLVKEILLKREKDPFLDLKAIDGLTDETKKLLSVNSSFFTIKVTGEGQYSLLKVLIQRSLGETKIINWMEK